MTKHLPQAPLCAPVAAVAAATALLSVSCATTEKKAREWAYANRDAAAGWCADMFPVRESELRPGRPVLIPGRGAIVAVDTLRLRAPCPDGTEAECPPAAIRTVAVTDTLLRVDTIRVRDRATERAVARRLERTEAALERAAGGTERWRSRFLWALAAAALLLWRLAARK